MGVMVRRSESRFAGIDWGMSCLLWGESESGEKDVRIDVSVRCERKEE